MNKDNNFMQKNLLSFFSPSFDSNNTLVRVLSCLTIAKNCLPQSFLQLNSEAIIKCQDLSREHFSSHLDFCAVF